jgi:hypothetical protein
VVFVRGGEVLEAIVVGDPPVVGGVGAVAQLCEIAWDELIALPIRSDEVVLVEDEFVVL